MANCFHSLPEGKRCFNIKCAVTNIMKEAVIKRTSAITNGCAKASPIFVAAEADDHKTANTDPAISHLRLSFTLNIEPTKILFEKRRVKEKMLSGE